MNLFKTTFWNGVATLFKILTGIVSTKIIAVILGPAGVAILGNFNNILGILTSFSNGAISNGIIKYIAENYENKTEQKNVISNAIKFTIVSAIIITTFTLTFNRQITMITIKNEKYSYATIFMGISIVFYGFNLTVSAILNGYREMKYLVINNIISSTVMMILAIVITKTFGLAGALINAMIAQVIISIVNIYFVKKLNLIKLNMLFKKVDKELLIKLSKFAIMAIVSAVVVPMSTFIIRNYVIDNFSMQEAGYIQGVWSISSSYLMVITTTLSVYYLPTLSILKSNTELRREIKRGYKFILPIAILGAVVIFISKDIIINILYTKEFLPMRNYFFFQNLGDIFKIASFLLAYLMIAKAMTKWYILSEIIFAITSVVFSISFMKLFGPIGATYGYALNYFIYLIFVIILFRKLIFIKFKH